MQHLLVFLLVPAHAYLTERSKIIFSKYKYTLTISGGTVSANSDFMRGMVEQVIITPTTSTNVWDCNFIDRDGDIIYSRTSETGTLNDRTSNLSIGRDSNEKITMRIANATINEAITIIFKIKEQL